MIPFVSNINFNQIKNAIFQSASLQEGAIEKYYLTNSTDVVGYLSRSYWSLTLIAIWKQKQKAKVAISIWVPDFFCDETLVPLRKLGVKLCFYPLNNDLEPDLDWCRSHSRNKKPDIFLLVHFFGCLKPSANVRDFCNFNKSWLVEDGAHVVTPHASFGKMADFIFFSPHKTMAVPNGSILIAKNNIVIDVDAELKGLICAHECWSGQIINNQKFDQEKYKNTLFFEFLWTIKKVLKYIGIGNKFVRPAYKYTPIIKRSIKFENPKLSRYSKHLLSAYVLHSRIYAHRRFQNVFFLDYIISKFFTDFQKCECPQYAGATPYLASYKASNIGNSDFMHNNSSFMIPSTDWPNLPIEVVCNENSHQFALSLFLERIYFPINESISPGKFYKLLPAKMRICSSDEITLEWSKLTKTQWHEVLNAFPMTNLMQTWEWGEAKHLGQNYTAKRGVFKDKKGKMVAIVQVLRKRYFGIVDLYIVNQGPLFIKNASVQEKYSVLRELNRQLTGIFPFRVMALIPFLKTTPTNSYLIGALGLRQIGHDHWHSSLLSLEGGLEQIRAGFNSKWRNLLNKSEKEEIDIDFCEDLKTYDWLLLKVNTKLSQENATLLDVRFYKYLFKGLSNSGRKPIIIRSKNGGDYTGAVCIVRHGCSATYLFGWTNELGRKSNINYRLLWVAIKWMVQKGVCFFDLGGFDDIATPQISHFKRGLGGEEYHLMGKFINLNILKR